MVPSEFLNDPFPFFVQRLAQDTTDVPGLQEEVIWVREATVAVEATCAEVVCAVAAFAQEAAVARVTIQALIKEAEA
jgi:hypothetical protein